MPNSPNCLFICKLLPDIQRYQIYQKMVSKRSQTITPVSKLLHQTNQSNNTSHNPSTKMHARTAIESQPNRKTSDQPPRISIYATKFKRNQARYTHSYTKQACFSMIIPKRSNTIQTKISTRESLPQPRAGREWIHG